MNIKIYLKTVCLTLAVFFIGLAIWLSSVLFLSTVPQKEGVVYNLKQGTSKKTFVAEVASQNIIRHPWIFTLYTSFFPTAQLKAGEYLFPKGASAASIWRQVTTGVGSVHHAFTIVPGWTFVQLKQTLAETDDIKHTITNLTDQQIMQQIGFPNVLPEGEFYPDTYYYTKDMADTVILKRAYRLMQKKLNAAWQTRDPNSFFKTPYDALIAASIIEKEAYLSSERPTIAGVLINRLKSDMLLQFDPTVIYGMGASYQGKIYKSDLVQDTPYNTYVHKGLPPTPIAMPSLSSINAVLHPEQHSFLYFVAKGDGSHQFSQTLLEHHSAVAEAIVKTKEIEKERSQVYVSPNAGQKYLQTIFATKMAETL